MLKYYIALFLVAVGALYYVYLKDPCNNLVKTDFSGKYPDFKILYTGAEDGTPENVFCHISYQKPDSEQVYEDVWQYQNHGNGWAFARILETKENEPVR